MGRGTETPARERVVTCCAKLEVQRAEGRHGRGRIPRTRRIKREEVPDLNGRLEDRSSSLLSKIGGGKTNQRPDMYVIIEERGEDGRTVSV